MVKANRLQRPALDQVLQADFVFPHSCCLANPTDLHDGRNGHGKPGEADLAPDGVGNFDRLG